MAVKKCGVLQATGSEPSCLMVASKQWSRAFLDYEVACDRYTA